MALARSATSRLGKLAPQQTALFVCDIQERFRDVISGMPTVIDTAKRLVQGANALSLPIVVTEQYPKALGATVQELKQVLKPGVPIVAKTQFSMIVPEVLAALPAERQQILLVGIETHVCVLQTTLDLLEKGYDVHVIVDGVSSQRLADRDVALTRLAQSGAFLASSEMVLFQLMKDKDHPAFKTISALVREQRVGSLPTASTPVTLSAL